MPGRAELALVRMAMGLSRSAPPRLDLALTHLWHSLAVSSLAFLDISQAKLGYY